MTATRCLLRTCSARSADFRTGLFETDTAVVWRR